jgi:phage terminase large subunit-like protein
VVTGTPRNTPLMRRLLKTEPGVTITRGSTLDNADNLSSQTVEYLKQRYEGTTLGRQELDGELLEVMPGALWDIDMIDVDRLPTPDSFERIVVAVDPAGSHRVDSDETGIVVVGLVKEHFYVLADYSGTYTPDQWAKQVIAAYNEHKADRVVAERNYGGDMVESTLRAADRSVSYRSVTATRGKLLRAEPIVALYEQHRVHHPEPGFPLLEDQMTSWVPPGQFETDERTGAQVALEPSRWSPDRVDALVWGVHELSQRRTRYSHG